MVQRPVVQMMSFIISLNFGIYCLMLSTYASLWTDRYNESEITSSLNYISIAIGTTVATQAGGPTMDWIYRKLRERNKGETSPEFRVPFLVPGVILIPVGLSGMAGLPREVLHGWLWTLGLLFTYVVVS